jgi:predicted site-specific integrase-resolvase
MITFKPQQFARIIGVSVKTLQRWDNEGKLKAYRTLSDRRYYTEEHILIFTNGNQSIANELISKFKEEN